MRVSAGWAHVAAPVLTQPGKGAGKEKGKLIAGITAVIKKDQFHPDV